MKRSEEKGCQPGVPREWIEYLLTEKEVSKVLQVSCRSLQAWRQTGQGPSYLVLGRLVRYRISDLDRWLENQVVNSTSHY